MGNLWNSFKALRQEEHLEDESRPRPIVLAANITPTPDRSQLQVTSSVTDHIIYVATIHLSCRSATYRGEHYDYAGVIIYQNDGEIDWRTENGTHCKSGYVVILDTNTQIVKDWRLKLKSRKNTGVVHGAVYGAAFDEYIDPIKVVGEGFSVREGLLKINSLSFNTPCKGHSEYHDKRNVMNETSTKCIVKVIQSWMAAGPGSLGCRNFPVKNLLSC